MIDVPDRAYVYVRLAAIKFLFRHFFAPETRSSMF